MIYYNNRLSHLAKSLSIRENNFEDHKVMEHSRIISKGNALANDRISAKEVGRLKSHVIQVNKLINRPQDIENNQDEVDINKQKVLRVSMILDRNLSIFDYKSIFAIGKVCFCYVPLLTIF